MRSLNTEPGRKQAPSSVSSTFSGPFLSRYPLPWTKRSQRPANSLRMDRGGVGCEEARRDPHSGARRGRGSLPGRGSDTPSGGGGGRKTSLAGGGGGAKGPGRGGGGGAACPLLVDTPATPSALLKTRESGARLGGGTASLTPPPSWPRPSQSLAPGLC